jgi:alpha-beta hydrolase superfamily lysophospholipase
MKHPVPAPPEIGAHDGLSYALFMPEGEPVCGVVICHGAGSAKESHFEFARELRAAGMAALAFDMRGHGRSNGALGPSAFQDARLMCELVLERAPAVALRGSSLGGFCAIGAAALEPSGIAAVVAICPAPEDFLLRGLRAGRFDDFRLDPAALEPWLESLKLTDLVARLSPTTALLLLHAQGDERIPYAVSEELFTAAGEPKRLLVLPGGHHRSLQHDLEIHAESVRFIEAAVRRRGVSPG